MTQTCLYVERIPNRNSPPAILLRESYHDGDKIRKRALANLSDWPEAKIEALRRGCAARPWRRSVARRCRCNAACPWSCGGAARDPAQARARSARIRQDVKPADLDFITALRAGHPQARRRRRAAAFAVRQARLAEITSLDYPGERLVVCRNPLLAEERARKRRELLARHRGKAAQDPGPRASCQKIVARLRRDRHRRWQDHQSLQDGQALAWVCVVAAVCFRHKESHILFLSMKSKTRLVTEFHSYRSR